MNCDSIMRDVLSKNDEFIYGYADLRGLVGATYQDHPYGIAIGKKLDDRIIDSISEGPTAAYRHLYDRVNQELTDIITKISARLRSAGIPHIAIAPTFSDYEISEHYMKTLCADFSHKMAATRAGLGWIGKTDLFISEQYGPRLRLATILTGTPLPVNTRPISESRCGSCRICVDACPGGAANGKAWTAATPREEFYDAFKCRETCRTLTKKRIGIDASLCGICVSVCPVGQESRAAPSTRG